MRKVLLGTFTNIFGQTFEGQAEFEKRHVDVFTGIFSRHEVRTRASKVKIPATGCSACRFGNKSSRDHKKITARLSGSLGWSASHQAAARSGQGKR
jgi:hypothetical protein